jgi:carbon monoxide dehydrogenase subunit G
MTSIIREFAVGADADTAWSALADIGAVNKLITFLGPVTVDGNVSTVDMGEFGIIEELIASVDPELRRVAYTVRKSPWDFEHHHSVMQILPTKDGAVLRWVVDLLPESAVAEFASGMDGAVESIKQSLA